MTIDFMKMQEELHRKNKSRIALVCADEADALRSLITVCADDLATAVLIGDEYKIRQLADKEKIDLSDLPVINESDPVTACHLAVQMARSGDVDALMKGLVKTSFLFKAVLNRESGIRSGKLLSHLAVFEAQRLGRPLFITDSAICINPDIEQKQSIIENAISVLSLLSYNEPKVACLCALESVNPAMQATLDAAELVKRNRSGEISGCMVGGPLALDNALFPEAAKIKNINDPVAGQADILLVPYIEVGNVLYKSLAFLLGLPAAGVIVGASVPVIISSRADSEESKRRSIILSLYLAMKQKELSI